MVIVAPPIPGFAGTSPASEGRKRSLLEQTAFLPRLRGRWSEGPEGVFNV